MKTLTKQTSRKIVGFEVLTAVSMTTTQKTAIFEQKDDLTEEHLIIS
jgi:hypothetical protein